MLLFAISLDFCPKVTQKVSVSNHKYCTECAHFLRNEPTEAEEFHCSGSGTFRQRSKGARRARKNNPDNDSKRIMN